MVLLHDFPFEFWRLRVDGWIRVVANALFPESSKGHAWSRGWLPTYIVVPRYVEKRKEKKAPARSPDALAGDVERMSRGIMHALLIRLYPIIVRAC